jgi:hypothetical protein
MNFPYLDNSLQNGTKCLMLTATVVIPFPRFNITKCDLITGFNVDINLRLDQTEWGVVIQRAQTSIDFPFEFACRTKLQVNYWPLTVTAWSVYKGKSSFLVNHIASFENMYFHAHYELN